jgi:two-component sensor histidine kinase
LFEARVRITDVSVERHVTPLDLDLRLSVTPEVVSPTRRLLEIKLATALDDDDAIYRVAMTAHELLENAAKYATDGHARLRVEVGAASPTAGSQGEIGIRVTLTNNAAPDHIDELRAAVREMELEQDPMAHYFALMRRNAKIGSVSRLGLARVRAEGDMQLTVSIDGPSVTIVASTVVRERAALGTSAP